MRTCATLAQQCVSRRGVMLRCKLLRSSIDDQKKERPTTAQGITGCGVGEELVVVSSVGRVIGSGGNAGTCTAMQKSNPSKD